MQERINSFAFDKPDTDVMVMAGIVTVQREIVMTEMVEGEKKNWGPVVRIHVIFVRKRGDFLIRGHPSLEHVVFCVTARVAVIRRGKCGSTMFHV